MAYSPQDVYARRLVSRRGYPLWTPEPNMNLPEAYVREGLKIGDVGVVVPEDGSFDVFFNVCLPPTHSLHRESGVPNNFTPILLSGRDIAKFPKAESAGRIISTSSVTRVRNTGESDEDPARRAQPSPLNYEFTLSSQEGAVLILPEGAERYYLRNERPFLDEAIQHAVDWYTFAEQRLGRIISHDSLYLITGFYKSRSWSLAAYERGAGTGEASAQFKALQVGTGNIEMSYTWETTQAMDWRVGPSDQYYSGIPNQTVFIHGFKIAIREGILGTKRVNVKADIPSVRPYRVEFSSGSWFSSLLSGGSGSRGGSTANTSKGLGMSTSLNMDAIESNLPGDESDDIREDITISRFPQLSNLEPFHPSDFINQYLLRKVPSASIAITHDGQWGGLLERGLLEPEEISQEDRLVTVISGNYTLASREGAVYLESTTTDSPFDDSATTASMSSEQWSEITPYTPSGLRPSDRDLPVRFLDASQPIPPGTMNEPLPGGLSGEHVGSDRSSTNCNSCKARNIKCNGARPLCGNCMRLSIACIYDLDTKILPLSTDMGGGHGQVTRHPEYYLNDGNVSFLAGRTLFRVHKFFFERESEVFREFFANAAEYDPQSGTDARPFTLDVQPEDFKQLLCVWYGREYSYQQQSKDNWVTILRLSTRWEFSNIRELAVRELEALELPPAERISIYNEYGIDGEQLLSSYVDICKSSTAPTVADGRLISMEILLKILQAREEALLKAVELGHKSPTSASLGDETLREIISKLFNKDLNPWSKGSGGRALDGERARATTASTPTITLGESQVPVRMAQSASRPLSHPNNPPQIGSEGKGSQEKDQGKEVEGKNVREKRRRKEGKALKASQDKEREEKEKQEKARQANEKEDKERMEKARKDKEQEARQKTEKAEQKAS